MDSTDHSDGSTDTEPPDVETILQRVGFDAERTLLTHRQAAVLVMRENGLRQAAIADHFETTRENVTGIEARARDNVEKARETVEFAEALAAPVRVEIPAGTDLYDAPDLVFDACDQAGIKVDYNAPELMKLVTDVAGGAVEGREVRTALVVGITSDGSVHIRKP